MAQQYYYSSLSGQQMDAALGQIGQAAQMAAQAAESAQQAKASADLAAESAEKTVSYSKRHSDLNFAPAIGLTASGKSISLTCAAHRPLADLKVFGATVQSATPSPENPVSLAPNGQVRVILGGRNLWCNGDATVFYGGSSVTLTDTGFQFRRGDYVGRVCVGIRLPLPKGETVRLGCKVTGSSVGACIYADTPYGSLLKAASTEDCVFTADRDYPDAVLALTLGDAAGNTTVSQVRVTMGSDAAFTPGQPVRCLRTYRDLYGIPMQPSCQKHNHTDAAGQKWFTDEIDLARSVYIQRCYKVTFDGSEPWVMPTGEPTIYSNAYPALAYFNTGTDAVDKGACIYHRCSHFKSVLYHQMVDGTVASLGTANGNALTFKSETYLNDLEGWKAWLAAQYAAGTPVTMILGRNKPVETALEENTAQPWYDLYAYPGDNRIYTDASAMLEVGYLADTKGYIDEKIAAISAAMLK